MKKQSKGTRIVLAGGYALLGLLLLFRPAFSIRVLCIVLGSCALIYGLAHLLSFWRSTKRQEENAEKSDLFQGSAFALLGIFCIAAPKAAASFLPFLLGLFLLFDGAGKLQRAFEIKALQVSRWWLELVFSLFLLGLGVSLLLNPFGAVETAMIFFGACLLCDGIVDLVFLFTLQPSQISVSYRELEDLDKKP